MPGMWDSDSRSAVARLDSILHFMSGYLKELAYYGHNVIHSIPFARLLGILAGFVEQLVPSLLEAQGQAIQQGPPTPGRQP